MSDLNLPSAIADTIPWSQENQAIWIASTLTLRRNLSSHNFPSKLGSPEADQVLQALKEALCENKDISNPQFFDQSSVSSNNRELIFEHFLFHKGLIETPDSSGVVLDDKGELMALINIGNHLEMRALNLSGPIEEKWNKLAQVEDQIGKSLSFAFSPKFGYLTANPGDCGTALTASAYLHLPALIHTGQLESALANSDEDEVQFMGFSGDLKELTGDLIIASNTFTVGLSEESILHCLSGAATKLIGAEKMMRKHLKEEQNAHIQDLISKAYGLLTHAHQLKTKEALDFLSLMKLGIAIDLVTGTNDAKLSELFFKCRRGHLSKLFPNLNAPVEIEQKRADYLQQELKDLSIKD